MIKAEDSLISASHSHTGEDRERRTAMTRQAKSEFDPSEIVIRPQRGWVPIDWKEMFAYRELLMFLIWRDISVRYKQTVLGSMWAILYPLILMVIFAFFFGRFVKLTDPPIPYPVFVFAGLIPWTLFSQGFAQAALSLVSQQNLLTKVYFPRLFVPIASASVFVIDLMYSLLLYAAVMYFYGIVPSWTAVFVPLLVVLTWIATLGLGLFLSAITVFYRDFRHLVPFLSQILLYCTPVIYPASILPPKYHWFLALNPMFGLVPAYRSAILGLDWDFSSLSISTASALLSFLFGIVYFRRTERRFADFA
jgi:lipopolysaccharide transport system permease protein